MTSKEAFEKMLDDLKNYESQFADGGYYANEERFDAVKKDLDLLEKHRKMGDYFRAVFMATEQLEKKACEKIGADLEEVRESVA